MGNILLTRVCNRTCPHCFARGGFLVGPESERQSGSRLHLALEDVDSIIAFLIRSSAKIVGLLGGEPTLTPGFASIVDRFLAAGVNIRLFSGGLIPPENLEYLSRLDPKRVRVVVNVPSPDAPLRPHQCEQFSRTLSRLGPLATPGFTVCDPDLDLTFLLELVRQFALAPLIRVGLSLPQLEAQGEEALPPAEYRRAAGTILKLAEACAPHKVVVDFDCGFVRCMFTSQEISRLEASGVHPRFTCGPIIDIGPDLTVWSCLPLVSFCSAPLGHFQNREEATAFFWKYHRPYRNLGIYDHCMNCEHKQLGQCAGGCLSHVIRSFA